MGHCALQGVPALKIGAVVARFQVDELTEGHQHLLMSVASNCDVVVVILGYDENKGSRRNPMDFLTRKMMLEAWWWQELPDKPLVVLPKHNRPTDEYWSTELDHMLLEMFPGHSIKLYGGRDSFLVRYKGKLPHEVVMGLESKPGTAVRAEIARVPGDTRDFRRGVIYGAYDNWPRVFMCVDVGLVVSKGGKTNIILGRRKNETLHRFFGGFVDQGESLETAAKRELEEESGAQAGVVKYLKSFEVGDYRYSTKDDGKVLTAFFLAKNPLGKVAAGDDIDEIQEFDLDEGIDFLMGLVVPSHKPLMEHLVLHLREEKK